MINEIKLLDKIHLQKYLHLLSLLSSGKIEMAEFEQLFLEIKSQDEYWLSGMFDEGSYTFSCLRTFLSLPFLVHIMNMRWRETATMARNKVQFQKGLSEAGFETLYGTEAKCRAVVIAFRWPNGFECPACGGRAYCEVTTRGLFQCSACRHQASPIAGTIANLQPAIQVGRAGIRYKAFK